MSQRISLLKNAYMKLDSMVLSFGLPRYDDNMDSSLFERYLGVDLNDTLREMRLKSTDSIEDMSIDEMYIENRIVYHTLRRFRNASSVYFKFSTAVDGKTVDKSMIPKMLSDIINEYDSEFKKWRMSGTSGTWNRDGDINVNANTT